MLLGEMEQNQVAAVAPPLRSYEISIFETDPVVHCRQTRFVLGSSLCCLPVPGKPVNFVVAANVLDVLRHESLDMLFGEVTAARSKRQM